jgi:hypothetical protein
MKEFMRISLIVIYLLIVCAMPGQSESFRGGGGGARSGSVGHFHGGGGHFHGGGWGWGPGWGAAWDLGWWGLAYPYYDNPYYGYPYYPYNDGTPVIVEQPATKLYMQPAPQQTFPSQLEEPIYWYYCQNPQGYYPYVKQCPKGWMKVVPSPPPPQR